MNIESRAFFDYNLENGAETHNLAEASINDQGSVGNNSTISPTPSIQSIIGDTDDRQPLSEVQVRSYPWRAICHLEIVASNGARYQGTGFLVHSRLLLTAAHNLFNSSQLGGYAYAIAVRPGLSGQQELVATDHGVRIFVTEKWKLSQNPDEDLGGLVLSAPVGDALGYFAYRGGTNVSPGDKVTVAGYPSGGNNRVYWQTESVAALGSTSLWYRVDTTPGQSGSPVWIESLNNSPRIALAVHTNDEQLAPPTIGEANRGIRLTPRLTELVDNWVKSL